MKPDNSCKTCLYYRAPDKDDIFPQSTCAAHSTIIGNTDGTCYKYLPKKDKPHER